MATKKLTKEQVAKLATLRITAKGEDDAKKAVLKFLKDNDIEEVDNEELDDLLEMAEAFVPEQENVEEEEAETDEELDEASAEDDDEEPLPAKKGAGKKPVAKPTKAAAKAPDKKVKKTPAVKSQRLEPKNNKGDRKHYAFLSAKFPEGAKFVWDWIVGGLAIKHNGKNSNKVLFAIYLSKREETIVGDIYFKIWGKNIKRLKEFLGSDFDLQVAWSGANYAKGVTQKQLEKLFNNKTFMTETLAMVEKFDVNLKINRDKMEANLKSKGTTPAKKAVAKPAAKPVAKKAAAPAPKKAAVKAPVKGKVIKKK